MLDVTAEQMLHLGSESLFSALSGLVHQCQLLLEARGAFCSYPQPFCSLHQKHSRHGFSTCNIPCSLNITT